MYHFHFNCGYKSYSDSDKQFEQTKNTKPFTFNPITHHPGVSYASGVGVVGGSSLYALLGTPLLKKTTKKKKKKKKHV
jgi:hypothetical protein